MTTYTTMQGDTFDLLAYRFYGEEKFMKYLIQENWEYADVLIFPSGIKLNIPDRDSISDEDIINQFWRVDEDALEDVDDE